MLLLTFRVADDLYAVAASQVVEVVPRVGLRRIPHAPNYLAGLFNFRGKAVPVVDLGILLGMTECAEMLHTRVILASESGRAHGPLLGLVAEHVSDVLFVEADQIVLPMGNLKQAPYLGDVVRTPKGLVQIINAWKVLPREIQDSLFGPASEAS